MLHTIFVVAKFYALTIYNSNTSSISLTFAIDFTLIKTLSKKHVLILVLNPLDEFFRSIILIVFRWITELGPLRILITQVGCICEQI